MSRSLIDILAMDQMAQSLGGCGGLNPRLRQAIEADLRWPGHAARPARTKLVKAEGVPENVTSICHAPRLKGQKK